MPLYEYQCRNCETRFERIEHVSSPSDGVCPACGGPARRLIGAPALQFKGSGWYVTDYGKGNGSAAATSTAEDSQNPPKNGSAASESTPKSESSSTGNSPGKSDSSTTSPKSDSKVA